jgi:hypothetical protein
MNCGCLADDLPPTEFLKSEDVPDLIRGEFKVSGSKYGLVIGRSVPVVISRMEYDDVTETYSLPNNSPASMTLTFDNDMMTGTAVKATVTLPLVEPGSFDPDYIPGSGIDSPPDIDTSERYTAVFPESELEKLAGLTWVMAELMTSDGRLVSRCAFNVLGGQ